MLVLAIDSTATVASAALIKDNNTICAYSINAGNTHSTTLLPMIENMLNTSGYNISQVDLFAASAGPGSFTGVRIGAATVKGLAFPENKPCVPVSSLYALAYNLVGHKGIICPAMNARRGQVYTALFESNGKRLFRLLPDTAMPVEALCEEIKRLGFDLSEIFYCGDGYDMVCSETQNETPEYLRLQNAVSVAHIAVQIYEATPDKSEFSAEKFVPTYLRKPQAQREREERLEILKNKEI